MKADKKKMLIPRDSKKKDGSIMSGDVKGDEDSCLYEVKQDECQNDENTTIINMNDHLQQVCNDENYCVLP